MRPVSARWRWTLVVAVAVLLIAGALWFRSAESPAPALPARPTSSPAEISHASSLPSAEPAATPPAITVMPTAAELGAVVANRDDPMGALQGVEQVIYFYRQAFGENPVGQNEDITAAILGENPGHAAFLPPGSPAIKKGLLLDPWQTPYWFHPVSGRQMEIRSAGPDRELFTADDLSVGGETHSRERE